MRIIPPTYEWVPAHVRDTCMKLLRFNTCKFHMLVTCRNYFRINNVSFSSTMVCVEFFLGEKGNTKQNSQEISEKGRDSPGIIPGQSRENSVYLFSCLLVFLALMKRLKNEKSAQRGSFRAGYPADIRGSFARISRPKTSARALKILEKNKHSGADIHDPKVRTSTTPKTSVRKVLG